MKQKHSTLQQAQEALNDVERFIERGTRDFLWTNAALFAAGFSAFALLYCVQPILPLFSKAFNLTPAEASLSASATAFALAIAGLAAGSLSEVFGRKSVMALSIISSAILLTLSAWAPDWRRLLMLRLLQGVTLSGLPPAAMAYISEEMHIDARGLTMGLYISGAGVGALGGRLIVSVMADLRGWRSGLFILGLLSLAVSIVFWIKLPRSRHFRPHPLDVRLLMVSIVSHLRDSILLALFAEGLLMLGAFMAFFNFLGYRLMAPPFRLSPAYVGMIFLISLVGIISTSFVADFAYRMGKARVLGGLILIGMIGVAVTISNYLILIIFGAACLNLSFYGAHTIASGWVGAHAQKAKAQASSLYIFFYYLGSSVIGSSGGLFWSTHGWAGVIGLVFGCLIVAGTITLCLRRINGPNWLIAGKPGHRTGAK